MKKFLRLLEGFCGGATSMAAILISALSLKGHTIGNGFYVWTLINAIILCICVLSRPYIYSED